MWFLLLQNLVNISILDKVQEPSHIGLHLLGLSHLLLSILVRCIRLDSWPAAKRNIPRSPWDHLTLRLSWSCLITLSCTHASESLSVKRWWCRDHSFIRGGSSIQNLWNTLYWLLLRVSVNVVSFVDLINLLLLGFYCRLIFRCINNSLRDLFLFLLLLRVFLRRRWRICLWSILLFLDRTALLFLLNLFNWLM